MKGDLDRAALEQAVTDEARAACSSLLCSLWLLRKHKSPGDDHSWLEEARRGVRRGAAINDGRCRMHEATRDR